MAITVHLDEVLKARGMTSKELCAIVGITEANLSILRSGKARKNDPPIPADLAPISGSGKRVRREQAEEKLLSLMQRAYAKREEQFTSPVMREIERVVTLRVVDEFWMDHIDAMDDLRQGIRLRAYAQTDPVIEYKREGFDMFEAMNDAIKEEIVRRVFLVRIKTNEEIKRQRVAKVTGEGAGGDKTVKRQPIVKKIKVGPNDPCPCGSGKKYKKCCRDKDLAAERGQNAN